MSDYSSDAAATLTVSAVERGRRAYRRKQTVRSILISLASTIVVAGVLITVVVNSDGWEATRNTFFNGKYFVEAFPQVLSGLWLNIRILAIAVLGGRGVRDPPGRRAHAGRPRVLPDPFPGGGVHGYFPRRPPSWWSST